MLNALLALVPSLASPCIVQEPAPAPTDRRSLRAELAEAAARAAHKNRRVLLLLQQEWHAPSTNLARILREDPKVKRELLYEYDLVSANLTMDPEAPALVRELGLDPEGLAAPVLLVLDPGREVIARADAPALGEDPLKPEVTNVMTFLEAHQAPPLDAEVVLRAALADAARSKRSVLVHFGAPW